jgi:hypothetical protein
MKRVIKGINFLVAVAVILILFKPHWFESGRASDVRNMQTILYIDGYGNLLNPEEPLLKVYGCDFWQYQIRLLEVHIISKEITRDTLGNVSTEKDEIVKNLLMKTINEISIASKTVNELKGKNKACIN